MNEVFGLILEKLGTKVVAPYFARNARYVSYDNIVRVLNEVAAEYKNGWIPCSSGIFPGDGEIVDVTVREENDNGGYNHYVFETWCQDGMWILRKNRYNPTVIAWRPKEAPYMGDECI